MTVKVVVIQYQVSRRMTQSVRRRHLGTRERCGSQALHRRQEAAIGTHGQD
jgi:hypothetical protein